MVTSAAAQPILIPRLVTVDKQGRAKVKPHFYQQRAYLSEARFIFVFAGTQGGKTSFLPWWLAREIERTADPAGDNDYLAVTATFDLFKLKFLPEMRRVFETYLQTGRYWSSARVIELCDPSGDFWARTSDDPMWGRIILRSAQSESGLESSTARGAILDECGMDKFRLNDWEAVQRRLSLVQGRVCGGTTLYNRGWTKSEIYDAWVAGDNSIQVIQFPSYMNPAFPREEYDRVAAKLPAWKLNMYYRGEFDVPAGIIYDCYDDAIGGHVVNPFPIPAEWPRYVGIDPGGVNFAATCYAEDPDNQTLFQVGEYLEGGKTAKEHAEWIMSNWHPKLCFGGAPSEDQWRLELRSHGLNIAKPRVGEVEVGIDRVYAQFKSRGILIFEDCKKTRDELGIYSRVLDPNTGEVTDKIKDKGEFHLLDSKRYVISSIRRGHKGAKIVRLG